MAESVSRNWPHVKGQLWTATSDPELLVGSVEVFVATALKFSVSLCLIFLSSALPRCWSWWLVLILFLYINLHLRIPRNPTHTSLQAFALRISSLQLFSSSFPSPVWKSSTSLTYLKIICYNTGYKQCQEDGIEEYAESLLENGELVTGSDSDLRTGEMTQVVECLPSKREPWIQSQILQKKNLISVRFRSEAGDNGVGYGFVIHVVSCAQYLSWLFLR